MATRIAVITGTARRLGIGRAIARRFVHSGYNVIGIDKIAAEGLDKEESVFTTHYVHHTCDVSSPADVSMIWAAATTTFPSKNGGDLQLSCLVNNAAIADPYMPPQSDPQARLDRWKLVLDVNLTGKIQIYKIMIFPAPA